MRYELKSKSYYRKLFTGSDQLFGVCWTQYRSWLAGTIDDPASDADVMAWLDKIASEKVNNSASKFYITG